MPIVPDPLKIEKRFLDSLRNYLIEGIEPGQFIKAILSNDLAKAIGHGDGAALENLPHIVIWLNTFAPSNAWGHATSVPQWLTAPADWRENVSSWCFPNWDEYCKKHGEIAS